MTCRLHRVDSPRSLTPRVGRLLAASALGLGILLATAAPAAAQNGGASGAARARQAVEDKAFEKRRKPQTKRVGAGFSGVAIGDEPLAAVIVEGNRTIPEHAVLSRVLSQAGRFPYDQQIKDDIRALYETRWFKKVDFFLRSGDAGLTLVFRVTEAPIVGRVQFIGNEKIKTNKLQAECGLQPGRSAYDVASNEQCVRRIEKLYRDKGHLYAKVTLASGSLPDQRDVIFRIAEGPKVLVSGFDFEGNTFVRSSVLKLHLETKSHIFWIGGKWDPETVDRDVASLEQYYRQLGFFDIAVKATPMESSDRSRIRIKYRINEGVRYVVRSVRFEGNEVLTSKTLAADLTLRPKMPFLARELNADLAELKTKYDNLGRAFARVEAVPEFDPQPGIVDLVYQIDEDEVKYIGNVNVHIRGDQPHTKHKVVRHQATRFLVPGELFKAADLKRTRDSLNGNRLWDRADPATVDVRPVDGYAYLSPTAARGQMARADAEQAAKKVEAANAAKPPALVRQTALEGAPPAGHSLKPQARAITDPEPRKAARPQVLTPPGETPDADPKPLSAIEQKGHRYRAGLDDSAAWALAYMRTPGPKLLDFGSVDTETNDLTANLTNDLTVRAQSPGPGAFQPYQPYVPQAGPGQLRGQSFDGRGLPNPQNYLYETSPQGDPFGSSLNNPPGYVDIDIDVTEAQTGRFMFGAGVNSDSGVVGQVSLEENNFDLFRPPRSWADIANGRAFRGGGQSFRLEAVPGSQVSRYLVSWEDPFFLDTDFSFGASGYYYQRFFDDWDEERLGGRLSIGRLLSRNLSLNTSMRLESVTVDSVDAGDPPILQRADGDNFLSTAKVGLRYDTRDSALLPSTGYMVEGSYEQGFGDYVYPKFDLTTARYFTTYQRADGLGKHTLRLQGKFGYTGDDTPVFERYYAGGFQTFRGFDFRGVSPIAGATNARIGGQFLSIGTVEYMLPITANDNFKAVVFSDFGTVEESVGIDNFRASVGFGFRASIAAMGPAPLAFDFAFPILSEEFDDERVFSFYIGFTP